MKNLLLAAGYLWFPLVVSFFVFFFGRRLYCHWICPLGFIQDLTGKVDGYRRKKVKGKKLKLIDFSVLTLLGIVMVWIAWTWRPSILIMGAGGWLGLSLIVVLIFVLFYAEKESRFRKLKYVFLVGWLGLAITGHKVAGPWCVIGKANLAYSAIIPFASVFFGSMVVRRSWCKYVCPDGGLLQLLGRMSKGKTPEDIR